METYHVAKLLAILLALCAVASADDNLMCGTQGNVFTNAVFPLLIAASLATATIITLSYMAGISFNNPRLTLWAKTEIIQLFISLASVSIIILAVTTFCGLDMKEIADIFDLPGTHASINVYDAARGYLIGATQYTHNAIVVTRYHLEAYTVLSYFNAFICDFQIGRFGLGCLFGYAGGTDQPFGGYSADIAAMNIFFNGMIIANFTVLNFLFVLLFVYKGFVFLFLPLGVLLRALPYMRQVGSLLIALALSFLVVYPFVLGIFYLMGNILLDAPNYAPQGISMSDYDENTFSDAANPAAQLAVSTGGEDVVRCVYFASDRGGCIAVAVADAGLKSLPDSWFGRENPVGAIEFAADAFIGSVFFPSLALLATIASVSYMARLMGEEIDLSRLTQLV